MCARRAQVLPCSAACGAGSRGASLMFEDGEKRVQENALPVWCAVPRRKLCAAVRTKGRENRVQVPAFPRRDRPMEFRPGQQCACPGLLSTASTVGDKPSPISDGSDVWCAFGRNFACQICPTAFSRLEGHGHTDARSRPNLRNAIAARHGTPPRCRRSSTI